MEAKKVTSSHQPPSDGGMAKEEFIRNLDGRIYCCPIPDDIQPDVKK